MTKQIIIATFLCFLFTTANSLSISDIKSKESDTIEIVLIKKDTIINHSDGTILIFKNKHDTTFLNLNWEDLQFDMGKPGITPSYTIKQSAPDGIYKIITNYIGQSKLVFPEFTEELIHFKNGKNVSENEMISTTYNRHECDSMKKEDSLVLMNGYKGNPPSYSKLYGYYFKKNLLKADGEFKNGYLHNGIYYIYNCAGVLTRKCIFKNGKYFADGQIED
ncbi:hypothetical protein FLAV_02562 [Flavobacteriales bacterium]|nr:hypothetical protein FLAV_02562 [Flavobacteriales bacterium]